VASPISKYWVFDFRLVPSLLQAERADELTVRYDAQIISKVNVIMYFGNDTSFCAVNDTSRNFFVLRFFLLRAVGKLLHLANEPCYHGCDVYC